MHVYVRVCKMYLCTCILSEAISRPGTASDTLTHPHTLSIYHREQHASQIKNKRAKEGALDDACESLLLWFSMQVFMFYVLCMYMDGNKQKTLSASARHGTTRLVGRLAGQPVSQSVDQSVMPHSMAFIQPSSHPWCGPRPSCERCSAVRCDTDRC